LLRMFEEKQEVRDRTADILRAARARLVQGWHQGQYMARAADGSEARPESPSAVSWCLLGAVYAASNNDAVIAARLALTNAEAANKEERAIVVRILNRFTKPRANVPSFCWSEWPEVSKSDVLGLFDEAIALAEGAAK